MRWKVEKNIYYYSTCSLILFLSPLRRCYIQLETCHITHSSFHFVLGYPDDPFHDSFTHCLHNFCQTLCPDEPEEGVNYKVVLINCCPSVLFVLIQLPHGSLLVSGASVLALIGWNELVLATAGLLIFCELIAKCLIIVLNFLSYDANQ